ncbi:MAG: hypothetical protein ACM34I_02200 [bacterium]
MFQKFTTTGIGSMPHRDPLRACALILDRVDIPFWPQLPGLSFCELMIPQYSEGMPNIRIVPGEQKIWVVGNGQSAVNSFYESYTEDAEFPISGEYARGFASFVGIIQGRRFRVLKGHVTGPLTFTLGLKDDRGAPVYFNEEMREISLMVLRGKVRWQINQLKKFCDKVMIFIDEPILSAIGTSAYMGVSGDEVARLISSLVSEIHRFNGIAAIHCCGKADWKLVMETGIDVVNFDAYDYFENFQIYADSLKEFLDRGGSVAAGIVPTSSIIRETRPDDLKNSLLGQIEALGKKTGFRDLPERLILTPSCGTGSLSEGEAERVFETLHAVKQSLVK